MTTNCRLAPWPATGLGIVAAVFVSCARPSLAALPCGTQPEALPVDVSAQIKSEAGLILLAPANAALRGLVTAKRRELRQKYAELEPTTLDHDLLWMVCQSIAKDHSLAASQQFDEYSNLYRLLSEPIKAAPAAE
jgi:hypothetical protein